MVFLSALAQFLIPEAPIVTADTGAGTGNIDAFESPDRWVVCSANCIPNCLGTALSHLVRQRKGTCGVCSYHFESTIGSAALGQAAIVQKHRNGDEFGHRESACGFSASLAL